MWSPKGLSNISNNASRLLSTTSMWSPIDLKPQVSDRSIMSPTFLPVRNISLSTTRFKEVFKRNKPHLNIGKVLSFVVKCLTTNLENLMRPQFNCNN